MNKENNNYSPISVINSEQILLTKYINYTDLAKRSSVEDFFRYAHISYLIKSNPYSAIDGSDLYCLLGLNHYDYHTNDYHTDLVSQNLNEIFGIIPTIPYKLVSKIVKLKDNGLYELGYYPQRFLWNDAKDCTNFLKIDNFITPNESEYVKPVLGEKFSFPVIEDNKVVVKNFDVYKIKNKEEYEVKVIFCPKCYKIEPVEWIKFGNDLVCTKVLFNSPVHMKNDYVKNDDIHSFDDTFLKWYIDNIFTRDLFKYTDLSFMKEQIPLVIDEDIDTKLKEIERLKQIKENLIFRQQSEEHILDTAQRSISSIFAEDNKDEIIGGLHR